MSKIKKYTINKPQKFNKSDIYGIWCDYSKAMNKRDLQPLSFDNFSTHIQRDAYSYITNNGFCFGEMIGGVSLIKQISYKNITQGFLLLKELLKLDNAAFYISEHLLPIFNKCGFYNEGLWFLDNPRGEIIQKFIFTSTKETHDYLVENKYNCDSGNHLTKEVL